MAFGRRLQAHMRVDALCVERSGADARPRLRPSRHRQRWPAAPALLARRPRSRIHDEGVASLQPLLNEHDPK